jgi:hypothetical protein
LSAEEICKALNISEAEFRVNFTTLRHMELARASEGDSICYTTFGYYKIRPQSPLHVALPSEGQRPLVGRFKR